MPKKNRKKKAPKKNKNKTKLVSSKKQAPVPKLINTQISTLNNLLKTLIEVLDLVYQGTQTFDEINSTVKQDCYLLKHVFQGLIVAFRRDPNPSYLKKSNDMLQACMNKLISCLDKVPSTKEFDAYLNTIVSVYMPMISYSHMFLALYTDHVDFSLTDTSEHNRLHAKKNEYERSIASHAERLSRYQTEKCLREYKEKRKEVDASTDITLDTEDYYANPCVPNELLFELLKINTIEFRQNSFANFQFGLFLLLEFKRVFDRLSPDKRKINHDDYVTNTDYLKLMLTNLVKSKGMVHNIFEQIAYNKLPSDVEKLAWYERCYYLQYFAVVKYSDDYRSSEDELDKFFDLDHLMYLLMHIESLTLAHGTTSDKLTHHFVHYKYFFLFYLENFSNIEIPGELAHKNFTSFLHLTAARLDQIALCLHSLTEESLYLRKDYLTFSILFHIFSLIDSIFLAHYLSLINSEFSGSSVLARLLDNKCANSLMHYAMRHVGDAIKHNIKRIRTLFVFACNEGFNASEHYAIILNHYIAFAMEVDKSDWLESDMFYGIFYFYKGRLDPSNFEADHIHTRTARATRYIRALLMIVNNMAVYKPELLQKLDVTETLESNNKFIDTTWTTRDDYEYLTEEATKDFKKLKTEVKASQKIVKKAITTFKATKHADDETIAPAALEHESETFDKVLAAPDEENGDRPNGHDSLSSVKKPSAAPKEEKASITLAKHVTLFKSPTLKPYQKPYDDIRKIQLALKENCTTIIDVTSITHPAVRKAAEKINQANRHDPLTPQMITYYLEKSIIDAAKETDCTDVQRSEAKSLESYLRTLIKNICLSLMKMSPEKRAARIANLELIPGEFTKEITEHFSFETTLTI